jgi:hypothetical protein
LEASRIHLQLLPDVEVMTRDHFQLSPLPDVEVLTGGKLQLSPEVAGDRVPVLVAGQELVDPLPELLGAHEVLQHPGTPRAHLLG